MTELRLISYGKPQSWIICGRLDILKLPVQFNNAFERRNATTSHRGWPDGWGSRTGLCSTPPCILK